MESFLRLRRTPQPEAATVEFVVLRPYVDLGPVSPTTAPAHARAVDALAEALRDERTATDTAYHAGAALRTRITGRAELRAFAVDDPARLPDPLRTDRWTALVERCSRFAELAPAGQKAVARVLDGLGMVEALASLGDRLVDPDGAGATTATLVERAEHLRRRTERTRTAVLRRLRDLAYAPHRAPRLRLSAALTLVVLHAQRGEVELARHARAQASDLRDRVELSGELDHVLASAYWRAVSFVPFLDGDRPTTRAELDEAQRLAEAVVVPEPDPVRPWLAREAEVTRAMLLHPLLETRTKEAVWAGELDLSEQRARRLARLDPFDGKVHVQLGNILRRLGRTADARNAYLHAAALGAPYEAVAWHQVGLLAEAGADLDTARAAWANAVRADPAARAPAVASMRSRGRAGSAPQPSPYPAPVLDRAEESADAR